MKIWTTKTADQKFSYLIRQRDISCVRCGRRQSSDASHFYERGNSATRYDPRNVDGACRQCHDYWHAHRGEYEEFKKEQLGLKVYLEVQRLGASTMKREEAITRFMKAIQ